MDDIAEKPPMVEAPFAEPVADAMNATLGAICDQAAGRDIVEAAPDSTGEPIAKPRGFSRLLCAGGLHRVIKCISLGLVLASPP